jgi:hypothetical protein
LQYRIGAVAGTSLPTSSRMWRVGRVLDQGSEGACVGFGCASEAAASPVPVPGADTNAYALAWYRRAQDLDEWPGRSYSGTSVLAGCLVGRERGLWGGFRWGKTAEELAAGIVARGPAILGVNWREDSYETDANGIIRAKGRTVGGHCVLAFGFVPPNPSTYMARRLQTAGLLNGVRAAGEPVFLILNSWGNGYGINGKAIAPLSLMRQWIDERAELAIPELRKLPTKGTP